MDGLDAQAALRKKELEEKKKKLAELRKRNEERKAQTGVRESVVGDAPAISKSPAPSADELVKSLVGEDFVSLAVNRVNDENRSPSPAVNGVSPSFASHISISPAPEPLERPRRKPKLSLNKLQSIDIPSKMAACYSKETQTTEHSGPTEDDDMEGSNRKSTLGRQQQQQQQPLPSPQPVPSSEQEIISQSVIIVDDSQLGQPTELPELPAAERAAVIGSTEFVDFFSRASRLIERALGQPDVTIDYGDQTIDDTDKDAQARESVSFQMAFYDDRWSRERAVTELSWSPKHAELFCAAYSSKSSDAMSNDPDGVVLVWNVNNKMQSEYQFFCQSAVTAASFCKYSSSQIVGGTYSGQVMLWDIRAKSGAVQRTPRSAEGHTHPVYCLSVVGTQNAHSLITVSTDGKMCVWSLAMLNRPQEVLELKRKKNGDPEVAVTSMAFPEGEVNQVFVGSEDGGIYQVYRYGSKSGVNDCFTGHMGPVTAVHFHPGGGAVDLSDLFVTSSTDWTCKLWSNKGSTKPLYSFEEAGDYVYDVQWSPTHPSLFASADGTGTVSFWNLNKDTEVPVLTAKQNAHALNRLRWSPDGRKVAVGNSEGAIHFYDVSAEFATPAADEWSRLEDKLIELRNAESASNAANSAAPPASL